MPTETGEGRGDRHLADESAEGGLYAPLSAARGTAPFVIGQLGQSLDGRIATATGKSRTISGAEAIRHLHRLRSMVDAVVVGADTVIADDPQLNVREVEGPSPVRVVIDPNGRMPSTARMIGDGGKPVYVIQSDNRLRPPGVEPILVARRGEGLLPSGDIVAALVARGFRRILVEGGATTVSAFLAAGALHRFHLSIAPILIGSGRVGVNLPPIDELEGALRPDTVTYRLGSDILVDCALSETPG